MAAPEMPCAPPSAPGRIAATARRFMSTDVAASVSCSVLRRLLTLRVPPACGAFRLWCSPTACPDVLQHTPMPLQNHGCLADASKSNGALLNLYTADACFAHTSTDTLCRCVSALRS